MKMVKSLLLGSAAGIVAVSGAQAADLPVKAKAVEYVRICSLYGKGFFYLPGSNDVCLSITGFVRAQIYYADGYNAASSTPTQFGAPQGADVRAGANNALNLRARYMMTFDSRAQTAYGTLRAVATAGFTYEGTPSATGAYANRGFIQIAGFTMGRAVSFFDFYSTPSVSYVSGVTGNDVGDGGWLVFGYTAQFGGGWSASIALEEIRRTTVINAVAANPLSLTVLGGALYTNSYVQARMPDIVGNLRWDQAWGSMQLQVALHDVASGYYGTGAGLAANGHPGNEIGWAIGGGVNLRFGPDVFQFQAVYAVGATRYVQHTQIANSYYQFATNTVGFGIMSDGVFGAAPTSIELTTAWGIMTSYDHRWSPSLKTSIYGGIMEISYNALACGYLGAAAAGQALAANIGAAGTCDWQHWHVGSRTQWDVAKGFYVGVDVLYQKLNTSGAGATTLSATGATPRGVGPYTIADQEQWSFTFRAHRDITP
jgi:hypothetical protein